MLLELLRIIILFFLGGALYGWIVDSFIYGQFNVEHGEVSIFISYLLIFLVIYRNYLQFKGYL